LSRKIVESGARMTRYRCVTPQGERRRFRAHPRGGSDISQRDPRAFGHRLAAVRLEPADRALQAFWQFDARLETEQGACALTINSAARLAVRLRGVPENLALKLGQPLQQSREIADADLRASAALRFTGSVPS
jgi:hypothetical protein